MQRPSLKGIGGALFNIVLVVAICYALFWALSSAVLTGITTPWVVAVVAMSLLAGALVAAWRRPPAQLGQGRRGRCCTAWP